MDNKIDLSKINSIESKIEDITSKVYSQIDARDSYIAESIQAIGNFNDEKYEREVENNENLKKIVDYNSEITEYNKQLVDLNKSILTKINSVNISLDFILEAIKESTQVAKEEKIEHNALLLELITIMESKDKNKITKFLGGLTGNVAAGLTVEYLKYKLGIS